MHFRFFLNASVFCLAFGKKQIGMYTGRKMFPLDIWIFWVYNV